MENNKYRNTEMKEGDCVHDANLGKWHLSTPIDKENSFPDECSLHRVTSLTDIEKYALTSLLIDPGHVDQSRKLTDDMLLTTPYPAKGEAVQQDRLDGYILRGVVAAPNSLNSNGRNSEHHAGLWKAHEVGILPLLRKAATKLIAPGSFNTIMESSDDEQLKSNVSGLKTDMSQCEPRYERGTSSISSLREDEFCDHYDSWQVLKDEYAEDFGFDYKPDNANIDIDEPRRSFQIIGTSADDLTAQPHVMSPPLMEALLSFVPESLTCENWWLKYSLVRDGASLDTFKNYTRAAFNTVVAIQTTSGDVFGSFTTSPWRTDYGYFGGGESFVWRMRHNRFVPCCSLFEQAQMETECDIFPYSGMNDCVQLCTHDMLGVGGGEISIDKELISEELAENFYNREMTLQQGFAIALHDDLLRGTTSPSATFCNPMLTSGGGGVFEVANLEVWAFTPCSAVDDAQRLEMKKFYRYDQMRHSSMTSVGSAPSLSDATSSQRMFYRRLGEE